MHAEKSRNTRYAKQPCTLLKTADCTVFRNQKHRTHSTTTLIFLGLGVKFDHFSWHICPRRHPLVMLAC